MLVTGLLGKGFGSGVWGFGGSRFWRQDSALGCKLHVRANHFASVESGSHFRLAKPDTVRGLGFSA